MAANARFDQLKRQVEKLRTDSMDLVVTANKILYKGVQKLADKELKALNDYYKTAVASIKKADKSDIKGAAKQQIDLLQDTVNTVIAHARESLDVVADARSELAKLIVKGSKGIKVSESDVKKAVAPARKAVKKLGKSAKMAGTQAKKQVKKTMVDAEKAVIKTEKSALKQAKKAAQDVQASAKSAASSLNAAVSNAVNAVTDAIKSQG